MSGAFAASGIELNFEGFRDLIQRVAVQWYALAKKELGPNSAEMASIDAYLANNPFTASQTADNEIAYEKLMDSRCKLFELSYEIDRHHDAYMEFMEQCLDKQDLLAQVGQGLRIEEKHLIYLELMIMEQVADWEVGTGRMEKEGPGWDQGKRLVVTLPNGTTKTVAISQGAQKRYWFGICPISSKIGNLKMCSCCKIVGYVGKEEQKEDWPKHKELCKILKSLREQNLTGNDAVSFLNSKLKRPLNQFEFDIANHPRVCMVCNKYDPEDELKNCKNCNCVAFCPKCVESGICNLPSCKALKIAAEDYKNEQTLGHQVHTHVPTSRKTYSELSEGIEKFFVADVTKLVSNKVPGFRESELRYLTFLYTCPLTTLFGMQSAMMPDRSHIKDAQSITIHLVGVRFAEFRNIMGWEIIAHELPGLKHLNLVFIGDECPLAELPRDFTYKSKEIQQNRKETPELRIRYVLIDKLYQDYAKNNSYIEPDFVVALDCGFKFYPSWKKAIPHMIRPSGAALIFTEFNEKDCQDNLDIVKKENGGGNLQIVNPPQRNPFQSLRPVRCSDKSGNYEPHSVIYTNDFISVVRDSGI